MKGFFFPYVYAKKCTKINCGLHKLSWTLPLVSFDIHLFPKDSPAIYSTNVKATEKTWEKNSDTILKYTELNGIMYLCALIIAVTQVFYLSKNEVVQNAISLLITLDSQVINTYMERRLFDRKNL